MNNVLTDEEDAIINTLIKRLGGRKAIKERVEAAHASVLGIEYNKLLRLGCNEDANRAIFYYVGLLEGLAISGGLGKKP